MLAVFQGLTENLGRVLVISHVQNHLMMWSLARVCVCVCVCVSGLSFLSSTNVPGQRY